MKAIKFLVLPLALGAAGSAMATQEESLDFSVTASIPSESFYALAKDGWDTKDQALTYDPATGKLSDSAASTRKLEVHSTYGALSAKVDKAPSITTADGSEIKLGIKVGGTTLTEAAQEVLAADKASTKTDLGVEIVPEAAGATGYVVGDYTGKVNLTFETPDP